MTIYATRQSIIYSLDQNDASLMTLSRNKMIYRWLYHVTAHPENFITINYIMEISSPGFVCHK